MWENLLFNLLQIGLTVSAVALIPIVLRRVLKKRYPARAMCLVWALLAVRLLIPVQLTLSEPPVQVTPHTYYLLHEVALPQQNETILDPPDGHWLDKRQAAALGEQDTASITTLHVGAVVVWIWLAGAMGFAAWQAVMYLLFRRRLSKNARVMKNESLNEVFMREKQALGITRDIPLLVSGAADCPMLAGLISPTLYLPGEALLREDAAFIFRHELIHYRHGDLWIKLLLVLARSMQWFNPLIHLMARFACEDIEMACDDAVAKNLDSVERRMYGETILRSAIDKAKRRSLVSCFTGDKKTLMRRFEGLFDARVNKRGAALVVAAAVLVGTLGCAFSVGGQEYSFAQEALRVAEQWARAHVDEDGQSMSEIDFTEQGIETENWDHYSTGIVDYQRFVTKYEPETKTCLVVYEYQCDQARVAQQQPEGEYVFDALYREAQRLSFGQEKDRTVVKLAVWLADSRDKVENAEQFELLFNNDLGLPDLINNVTPRSNLTDPVRAAIGLLSLKNGSAEIVREWDATADGENDYAEVRYTFADGSAVRIVLAAQSTDIRVVHPITGKTTFEETWNPQDWTAVDGTNNRTAIDLTQQFARAVYHKYVPYLYPILSSEEQQALADYQRGIVGSEPGGVWYTKLGGSSPSFRDYVIVSTDDPKACIAVLQSYGGGSSDGRVAYCVTTGQENGRSVITAIENLSDLEYTQSDKFNLYYGTELGWPSLEYALNIRAGDAGCYNGPDLSTLRQPDTALQSTTYTNLEWYSQFHGETLILSQNESDAVVRLTFDDGSGSVDVHMHKDGDYWLPVGLNS